MNQGITIISIMLLSGVLGGRAFAQQPDSVPVQHPPPPVLQAIGGSIVGSMAGMAAGVALSGADGCGPTAESPDDRTAGCDFGRLLGLGLGGSMLGAATGAWVGAKLGGGSPSAVRSALGAVGGVAGALLTAWAVDGLGGSANGTMLSWHVGQGAVTGLAAAMW